MLPITLKENERQGVSYAKFCNFCFQNSYFSSPQKWINLISARLRTASIKYLNWPSPVFGRLQNEWNKVVIEPRVVQFGLKSYLWFQIELTLRARSILKSREWFQPKFHSTRFIYPARASEIIRIATDTNMDIPNEFYYHLPERIFYSSRP